MPTGGFEPSTSGFPTAVKHNTYVFLEGTNASADATPAHHGQNREKEKEVDGNYYFLLVLFITFLIC